MRFCRRDKRFTNLLINRQNFDKEYQIVHGKTGESRWVHGLGQLRLDDEGRPVELFGTIQDIHSHEGILIAQSELGKGSSFQIYLPVSVDLVISDLTMPTMTGVDLAAKLQQVRAEIPVIIMAGYDNCFDEQTQKGHGIRHVAGKPLIMDELVQLIRQVLDA